jgi:hypothetical protein
VREDEPGEAEDEVPVQEKVEVERPRSVAERGSRAACVRLDPLEHAEELEGREARPPDGDGVQEVGLGRTADGGGP